MNTTRKTCGNYPFNLCYQRLIVNGLVGDVRMTVPERYFIFALIREPSKIPTEAHLLHCPTTNYVAHLKPWKTIHRLFARLRSVKVGRDR